MGVRLKLLVCVTFHFRTARLAVLKQVLAGMPSLADSVHVYVITNTTDPAELDQIRAVTPRADHCRVDLSVFNELPNPWLLPWAHKTVMLPHVNDPSYTHFMCIEDDIEVTRANVNYWVSGRQTLRPYRLYPSFLRSEWNEALQGWVSTDVCHIAKISELPHLDLAPYVYVNIPQPYQGMFFYDRELMEEHVASPSFDIYKYGKLDKLEDPSWGGGGSAEAANFALTFMDVPDGCISRNFVRCLSKYQVIDPGAFVHHVPNNYANDPATPHGKILLSQLVVP